LRYATGLLFRFGDHTNAAALHRAIVEAGLEPPLSAGQVAVIGDGDPSPLTGVAAVELARTALQGFT
jgi:hypothetical protein